MVHLELDARYDTTTSEATLALPTPSEKFSKLRMGHEHPSLLQRIALVDDQTRHRRGLLVTNRVRDRHSLVRVLLVQRGYHVVASSIPVAAMLHESDPVSFPLLNPDDVALQDKAQWARIHGRCSSHDYFLVLDDPRFSEGAQDPSRASSSDRRQPNVINICFADQDVPELPKTNHAWHLLARAQRLCVPLQHQPTLLPCVVEERHWSSQDEHVASLQTAFDRRIIIRLCVDPHWIRLHHPMLCSGQVQRSNCSGQPRGVRSIWSR
mmetsp:Transcript_61305/g.162949  ORF Transcript_61305/g.162949 Transcript_61305/m.162949 type:complete len:266 (+) Transcript_61305:308-1105(+)